MSRKSKLILATALFGAALFAASCGGGGGGGTTAGTGTGGGGGGGGGGNQPPPATEEGKVLAMLNVGGASAGPLNPVAICKLMSNNKVECGNDLNPNADVALQYFHEFRNGNILLSDANNVLYFFDGNQVRRLTTFRRLGIASTDNVSTGITAIITGTSQRFGTRDFVIMYDGAIAAPNPNLVVVTSSGEVIRDNIGAGGTINTACEAVTTGAGATFKLSTDGIATPIVLPALRARAGGKFLLQNPTDNSLYLSSNRCSAVGDVVVDTTIGGALDDAQMVKVGDDEFYIAARRGTNLRFYKVSGDSVTNFTAAGPIVLNTGGRYYYALDGRGFLYANTTDANTVSVYNNAGGLVGTGAVNNVQGLLGFADRALAKDNAATPVVYEVYIDNTGAVQTANRGTSNSDALHRCTQAINTRAVDGMGTNFIRCVFDDGSALGERLLSLVYDTNDKVFKSTSSILSNTASTAITDRDVRFGANNVLVRTRAAGGDFINLCTTTTSPSISCSSTTLPGLDTTRTDNYLKSNGNNVFYLTGTTLMVGDIFGTLTTLPIAVTPPPAPQPTGGNASFDLTKFAFSFQPPTAPLLCNTHIAYLSSPAATPKFYALPSGSCVQRILKVY
jgi:hypothetical protein